MLYQSDDLALADIKQRRQQLLDEAHAHRQARYAKAARQPAARSSRPRRSDRFFHATGALLVRWGMHLQQRGQITPSTFVDTRPA